MNKEQIELLNDLVSNSLYVALEERDFDFDTEIYEQETDTEMESIYSIRKAFKRKEDSWNNNKIDDTEMLTVLNTYLNFYFEQDNVDIAYDYVTTSVEEIDALIAELKENYPIVI